MIKEEGTVKIGVYLSRETWDEAVSALRRPEQEIAEDIETQLASPASWISGAKEQG